MFKWEENNDNDMWGSILDELSDESDSNLVNEPVNWQNEVLDSTTDTSLIQSDFSPVEKTATKLKTGIY